MSEHQLALGALASLWKTEPERLATGTVRNTCGGYKGYGFILQKGGSEIHFLCEDRHVPHVILRRNGNAKLQYTIPRERLSICIDRGSAIVFEQPSSGNHTPRWMLLKDLVEQVMVTESPIKIRVRKELWRDGRSRRAISTQILLIHWILEDPDSFRNQPEAGGREIRYIFEKEEDGTWTECEDPRGPVADPFDEFLQMSSIDHPGLDDPDPAEPDSAKSEQSEPDDRPLRSAFDITMERLASRKELAVA